MPFLTPQVSHQPAFSALFVTFAWKLGLENHLILYVYLSPFSFGTISKSYFLTICEIILLISNTRLRGGERRGYPGSW